MNLLQEYIREAILKEQKMYEYGVVLRPIQFGGVPKGYVGVRSSEEFKHGIVQYSKPLSTKDIEHFDLIPLDPKHPYNLRKKYEAFKKKVIEEFSKNNIYTTDHSDGRKTVLHWSARDKTKFQITFLDPDGTPTGHIIADDFDTAIEELWIG